MKKYHLRLGKRGELLAKSYLECLGWEILDENWRFKKAEIDLIAYYKEKVLFVEVKTRRSSTFGEPEESVDHKKRRLLGKAADAYINLMDYHGEVRFDVVTILFNKASYVLKHIEDAFWPEPDC